MARTAPGTAAINRSPFVLRSVRLADEQTAVFVEVTDGVLRLALRLVETRQVEVTIGERGVRGERALVGSERLCRAPEVLEHNTQVEHQERVLPTRLEA